MPLFEYVCKKCNHQFEELVFSNQPLIACPECHSTRVEKAFSTFGVSSTAKSPCEIGACGLPGPMPSCGSGACPACLD